MNRRNVLIGLGALALAPVLPWESVAPEEPVGWDMYNSRGERIAGGPMETSPIIRMLRAAGPVKPGWERSARIEWVR